jgi:hypothetical protein
MSRMNRAGIELMLAKAKTIHAAIEMAATLVPCGGRSLGTWEIGGAKTICRLFREAMVLRGRFT